MSKRVLTKGVLTFTAEDGEAREVGVVLFSDESYTLLTPAEKAKLFPAPANPRPTGSDGETPTRPFKFFKPPTQGKRMPNGLWNSSVPLPGHDIYYSEGDVRRK